MNTQLKKSSTGSIEMDQVPLIFMNSSSVLDGSVATTNMSQLTKMLQPSRLSGGTVTLTKMVSSHSRKLRPTLLLAKKNGEIQIFKNISVT